MKATADLKASGLAARSLEVGKKIRLPDADKDQLSDGPVVLIFYRGGY